MKILILFISFLLILTFKASAQQTRVDSALLKRSVPEEQGIPIKDVIKHIGTDVYIRDTVTDSRVINSSLRLLYLGGKYPKQVLTIIIKGKKLNQKTFSWFKSGLGYFNGKAFLYKNKPAILVTSIEQFEVRVQI